MTMRVRCLCLQSNELVERTVGLRIGMPSRPGYEGKLNVNVH